MTVESTARKQTFAGAQSALTFSFRTLANHPEYIKVKNTVVATGVETDLTYGVDYTVALESDGTGGVVTVSPTFSASYNHTVYRVTDNLQESDYDDFNQFPADTVENDLDRRTLIAQEASEDTARTAKVPISSTIGSVTLPAPEDGKLIGWSGGSGAMSNYTLVALNAIVVDTDVTLAANSDTRVASQKATKGYVSSQGFATQSYVQSQGFLTSAPTGDILSLNYIIDGGGSAITTGVKGDIFIAFNCIIQEITLLADQSGSAVIDIWNRAYSSYPPTVSQTICGTKGTLSSAVKYQDSTLGGWTTSIPSASTLRFNVDSASTVTRLCVHLKLKKTSQ